jgi:hypothetical protein
MMPSKHYYNLKLQAFHEEATKANLLGATTEQIFGLNHPDSTMRRAYTEWTMQCILYGLEGQWILQQVVHQDNFHCKVKVSTTVLLCDCNIRLLSPLQNSYTSLIQLALLLSTADHLKQTFCSNSTT